MNLSATLSEIVSLDVEDRIRLVEAIWDSIAVEPGRLELTDAQRKELEHRLASHASSPDEVVAWEEVKAEALTRTRK